jgi:hypothetical protein
MHDKYRSRHPRIGFLFGLTCEYLINALEQGISEKLIAKQQVKNFYCCTVHFAKTKILFTNKCTLLLNIKNVKMYS